MLQKNGDKWCSSSAIAQPIVKKAYCLQIQTRRLRSEACLDEVETLGKFVEIEIVADAAQKQQLPDVPAAVSREIGLEKSEPRSYLKWF